MTIETLRLARNILLRSALICYIFLILSVLVWVPMADTWTSFTSNLYHVTPEKVHNIVVDFFSAAKFYTMFLLLAPGLALHWTIKKEQAK